MFEKILVPLDGSEHSFNALDKAIQIAEKFDGQITLIHVFSAGTMSTPSSEVCESVQELRKKGESILARARKEVKAKKIPVKTLIKEGQTVNEILKAATDGDFSLIVIGARGISKLREILLGSVSDGVIRHGACPVLVVK